MRRMLTGTAIALALACAAAVVHAATLTGKWQGETQNGTRIELDVKATDTTLTGTLTRDGESSAISEGKVTKESFTFKATIQNNLEPFTGEMAGEDVRLWPDRIGRDRAVILKRVKP